MGKLNTQDDLFRQMAAMERRLRTVERTVNFIANPARIKTVYDNVAGVGGIGLPAARSVTIERPSQLWLLHATGWRSATGSAALEVRLNGVAFASLTFYFNNGGVHHALPARFVTTAFAVGTHTVSFASVNGLNTDENDYFQVVMMELGG